MIETWLRVGIVFLIEPASLEALNRGYHPLAEEAVRVATVVELWNEGDGWQGTVGLTDVDWPELEPDTWGAPTATGGTSIVWPGDCPVRIKALPDGRFSVDCCGTKSTMVRWQGTDQFLQDWRARQVREHLTAAARQSPWIVADGAGWRIGGVAYSQCRPALARCREELAIVCGDYPRQVGVWTEDGTLQIARGSLAKCIRGGSGFQPDTQ